MFFIRTEITVGARSAQGFSDSAQKKAFSHFATGSKRLRQIAAYPTTYPATSSAASCVHGVMVGFPGGR